MGVQKVSRFGLGQTGGSREGRNRGLHQSALLSDWSGDEEAFSSDSLVSLILEGHSIPLPVGGGWYQRICSVFSVYSPARISRAGEWALEAFPVSLGVSCAGSVYCFVLLEDCKNLKVRRKYLFSFLSSRLLSQYTVIYNK